MSRSDRLIGIALGLVIGVVAVILFVFLGGSDSIDAPSLDAAPAIEQEAEPGAGGAGGSPAGTGTGAEGTP